MRTPHPERHDWFQEYGCSRYEVDATELEDAGMKLIAERRGSDDFEATLRQIIHEEDSSQQAVEARVTDFKRNVARAKRLEEAAIHSLIEARADGKENEDLASFKTAVERAQNELRNRRTGARRGGKGQSQRHRCVEHNQEGHR